jgi:DNA polymerase III delta prime subunit
MEPRLQFAWVEKWRPQTIDECILPQAVRATMLGILSQKDTPHLLFTGRAGVGKTTVAKALVRELGADALVINASEENGIDVLRGKIKDYASTMGFAGGGRKYVILDESDYLHPQSTQPALRVFMEEFSQTTCFILTCNFLQRVIAPIQSRCSIVDFKIPSAERPAVAAAFTKRVVDILTKEGVKFNVKLVAQVVALYFPDFRRVLNELQRFSSSGELSEAILSQITDKDINDLFGALKSQDFSQVRKWIGVHDDMDSAAFYRMLMDSIPKNVDDSCLAEMIVTMADYSYKSGFCADPQLNNLACLVEILHNARWK